MTMLSFSRTCLLLLLVGATTLACGSSRPAPEPTFVDDLDMPRTQWAEDFEQTDGDPAGVLDESASLSGDPIPDSPALALVPVRQYTVGRARVEAVLDRGPGAFLRGIHVTPSFRRRQFIGWLILDIDAPARLALPGPADMRGGGLMGSPVLDLQPGDIVGAINGQLVERPRHLYALWQELRSADAIEVQIERDGEPFALRFEITDRPLVQAP